MKIIPHDPIIRKGMLEITFQKFGTDNNSLASANL
jgi:hypothetical protein